MKRLTLLFTTMLMLLTFAGCDLLPDNSAKANSDMTTVKTASEDDADPTKQALRQMAHTWRQVAAAKPNKPNTGQPTSAGQKKQ